MAWRSAELYASRSRHWPRLATRAAARSPAPSSSPATVVQLHIDSEIEPILAEYIVNGIEQANRDHASLILITMDTPGGLDTSMREIIQSILQSPVPVVTYVYATGSRAASAGFFILLSADIAAMSPGTDTGAASPDHGDRRPDRADRRNAAQENRQRRHGVSCAATWPSAAATRIWRRRP